METISIIFGCLVIIAVFITIFLRGQQVKGIAGMTFYEKKDTFKPNKIINASIKQKVKDQYHNHTIQDGFWKFEGCDIEMPEHSLSSNFEYVAPVKIENQKNGNINISGDLNITSLPYGKGEKQKLVKLVGTGYCLRGELSILYRTYQELDIGRITSGLGVAYIKFNTVGKDFAEGYIITSNASEFGMGFGKIKMKRL